MMINRNHRWLVVAVLALGAARVTAHPHTGPQFAAHVHTPLGLEIAVADDGVTCNVLLSNGYLNMMIPHERGRLKLSRRGEAFVTFDPRLNSATIIKATDGS